MSTSEKSKGIMAVFISGKGGVGKTIISVNTAVKLAAMGFPTCIMDGNLQFGDVSLALDIQPSYTISDLIYNIETLKNDKISYYLNSHTSGVNVLAAPIKPEQADLIESSHMKIICHKILEEFNFFVVDLPPGLMENNLSLMEMADYIFIVTDTSFASLKSTKSMLRTMKMLKMDEKARVVINRHDAQGIIKGSDIQNMLDVKNVAFICNDTKLVSKSFAMGIPFVISKPKEKISKDVAELAIKLSGKQNIPEK